MKTVDLYEYEELGVIHDADRPPKQALSRRRWIFEVRCDYVPGVAVTLRAVVWQTRASARHKWTNERGWYWNRNDLSNPRMMPSNHFIDKQPKVQPALIAQALDVVRGLVRFESEQT